MRSHESDDSDPHPHPHPHPPSPRDLGPGEPARRPLQVLVVDDDEEDFLIVRDLLADIDPAGYEASHVTDADAAVDRLRSGAYDVALLDQHLGPVSGMDLLRAHGDDPLVPPIVFLTGVNDDQVDRQAMLAGAADYVDKRHMTPASLERSIRYAAQHRRHQSEQQKLAAERAARREAEATSRAKDEFLAMLSHELRTPLMAITGWLQILEDPQSDDAERIEAIQTIGRNARHQTALVNDMLDLAGVITGKLTIRPQAVDLPRLAAEAVDALRPAAEQVGLRLSLEVDGEPAHAVHGDPRRLRQVLYNLLHNAIKFSEPADAAAADAGSADAGSADAGSADARRVRMTLTLDDERAVVEVHDAGRGIAPELLPRVFDRFRQGNGDRGGLGLGLTLVRHLVELHGGHVVARSTGEGHGSTFTVTLPAGAATQP